MRIDPAAAYRAYSDAWNEQDGDARRELLDQAWSERASLFDEETPEGLSGRESLDAYIVETHEEMPGLVIAETSEPEILGNRLRVRWEARQDGEERFTGTDFVEFDEEGRISRVTMFYDSTPD